MSSNQNGQNIRIVNNDKKLEQLEIKSINTNNNARFNQLQQVWKEHDIPECHQKYYYNVLLEYQQQANELIEIEIQSITNNKSVVKTLHLLTIGRERCLKEISRAKQVNISDFLETISKFIYHLRKITLNLIDFHRKWKQSLISKYDYNYIWKIKDRDYLHQIMDDHKFIQNHHYKIKEYFQFTDTDIFYKNIVMQAREDHQQKYDYLKIHKMEEKYVKKMIELQEYFNQQTNDYKPLNLSKQPCENSDMYHANSPGFQNKNSIHLENYASKIIYTAEDLEFSLVSYPYKDLEQILEIWYVNNVQELNDSFKYPINHIKDILMYWQEAAIVRINQSGLIICSIDQEYQGRRWILHQIYIHKDQQWKQRFSLIIQHFIKMLMKQGDSFTSLAICCSNEQSIKKLLIDLKFIFSKNITYNLFNVVIYEQKIYNTLQHVNRQYYTPLNLRMLRIYTTQIDSTLITNEELLIAQYCANIGKNTFIRFENNILTLSPYLHKFKLYGQEFMLIQNPNDVKNKYQIEFSTPIQTPVYFQQFNIKLNFKYFSSEFYRNNTQPYLRLIAHPTMNEQEPSILQLSSSEISNSMIYLISTINPFIKIYIQEVQSNQISKSNIQSFINQTFEKFDKKQECQHNVWLPQFKCCGKQLTLTDTNIEAYFQNDTYLSVIYPRNPSLHTNQYFNELDKIIQPPFLFGIVQSDLEKINQPLFSILIDKEHIIKTAEKPINNTSQILQLQTREFETIFKDLFKNTAQEIKKSFCSDPAVLIYKFKYSLECSLINLNIGHAFVYVDENHIFEKKWIIETIMIDNLTNLSQLLTKLIEYIFTTDNTANEIQISQIHYQEQGQLIANKSIMDSIKQAKFRWRQVDNDAKTQIRKTIYYLKRSIQDYPNKIPNQVSVQFRSYYAIQQSEKRNQIQNNLEYLHSSNEYQFFEDCFQYHVHGKVPDSNSFLQQKLSSIQGKLPNTEFMNIHTLEELKTQIKFSINLPCFESKFDQFELLQMITQLKIKKQRQVICNDKKYLEIPNCDGLQQIFQSENYQLNQKIFFIATQDPLYFMYFIELVDPSLIEQINKSGFASTYNISTKAFVTKYLSSLSIVWIKQFQKIIHLHEKQNYLFIDFALNSQFSIEQSMTVEEDLKKEEEIYKIQLPMYCGLLNTNVRTQLERPLVGVIIE